MPRGPTITRNADDRASLPVLLAAIADTASPLGYLSDGPIALQAAGLGLKLLLVVANSRRLAITHLQLAFVSLLVCLLFVGSAVDALSGTTATTAVLRYAGTTISLALTFMLVPATGYYFYCAVASIVPTLAALVHILLAHGAALTRNGTRFFYLGNSHPNLGGEIAAIAAIAAAIGLRTRLFIPVAATLMYSAHLSQARAAQLAIGLAILARLMSARAAILLVPIGLVAAFAGTLLVPEGAAGFLLGDVLRYDDVERGIASGFAGRDVRWMQALQLFDGNPLFGAGIGLFELGQALSPHNALLYSLAHHGAIASLFWLLAGIAYVRVFRASARDGVILGAATLMLLFNDRFINLNPYPFLLYVMLFCHPGATRADRPARRASIPQAAVQQP